MKRSWSVCKKFLKPLNCRVSSLTDLPANIHQSNVFSFCLMKSNLKFYLDMRSSVLQYNTS